MRLRLEGSPSEFARPTHVTLGAMAKGLQRAAPGLAEALEKAAQAELSQVAPVEVQPRVLRDLQARTAALYQKTLTAMLAELGEALDAGE